MCGIGGVMMFPKNRSEDELNYIRTLIEGILVENEIRGNDSAGIAAFTRHGHSVFKYPMRASMLVETDEWSSYLKKQVTNDTFNVLLHTRLGTKGSEQNNDNNHPIETYSCIGIHNGWIANDDELFDSKKMFRQAEVDSEVIFRLVDAKGVKLTTERVKEVAQSLSGAFTFAFCKKIFPTQMWLVRNDNPVALMYVPELNIIAFASMARFLEQALVFANGNTNFSLDVRIENAIYFEPDRGTIYRFDVRNDTPQFQLKQVPTDFDENIRGFYAGYGVNIVDEEEEEQEVDSREFIADLLPLDYHSLLDDLIDKERNASWSQGYSEGRKSLADELSYRESIMYRKGYEKGLTSKALAL